MHQILRAGRDHDEPVESIEKWLSFLTNPDNLSPALPGLTVYFGDARFCSIVVTFDKTRASLRSLRLELNYIDDDYAQSIFRDLAGPKEWISKIFLHPGLEEIAMAFLVRELPDRFHKIPELKVAELTDSKLIELPASFYQLPALEKLCIHGTAITELPSELGNLKTLRHLSFSQTWSPAVWGTLKGLRELCCYGCMLPENFFNFPLLEKLYFRVNRNSKNIRFKPVDLPCLKELNTDNIEVFGDAIAGLKKLEKLTAPAK